MVDCPERSRISRDIAMAVREEAHMRRQLEGDRLEQFHRFRSAREKLKRLREEYRVHITEHGCLPAEGSRMAADASS